MTRSSTDQVVPRSLVGRAESAIKSLRQARDWLGVVKHADYESYRKGMAMNHPEKVEQDLRRAERNAEKLARAAAANVCVAIYGQSQVGKSQLVSVFARPGHDSTTEGVEVEFEGINEGPVKFFGGINPASKGGKETTGLVTRFMGAQENQAGRELPSEWLRSHPVQLRLLSEADILIVIMKMYFQSYEDSKDGAKVEVPEMDENDVVKHMQNPKWYGRNVEQALDEHSIVRNEILDALEYAEEYIAPLHTRKTLSQFWNEAPDIASTLPLAERAQFLSLLWKQDGEALTSLYLELVGVLESLERNEYVYVNMEALCMREEDPDENAQKYKPHPRSIVLVDTFLGVDNASTSDDTLKLCVQSKSNVPLEQNVSRRIVCTLAAELILPVRHQAIGLPDGTDILDMPGARSPDRLDKGRTEESLRRALLRAKLDYLFDRYTKNFEISALVVCFPKDPPEVEEMPKRIYRWVTAMHGSVGERQSDDCRLFVVVGKMDLTMVDLLQAVQDPNAPRDLLESRIDSTLQRLRPTGFVDQWCVSQGGQEIPFKNMFWFRNPTYRGLGELLAFDLDRGIELEPKSDQVDNWMGLQVRLKEAAKGSNKIGPYFNNPEEACDALFEIGDGGASYILREVRKACTPMAKNNRIETLLNSTISRVAGRLDSFHGNVNPSEFNNLKITLEKLCGTEQSFRAEKGVAVLSCLSLKEDDLISHLQTVARMHDNREAMDDQRRTQFFVTQSLRFWTEQAELGFQKLNSSIAEWNVQLEECERLIREIESGMGVDKLNDTMCSEMDSGSYPRHHHESSTEAAFVAAMICAECINQYIDSLDNSLKGKVQGIPEESPGGPRQGKQPQGINSSAGDGLDCAKLEQRLTGLFDESPEQQVLDRWETWLQSLRSMCDRISSGGKENIDPELDQQLGEVLKALRCLTPSSSPTD